jgi:hypothetical protein
MYMYLYVYKYKCNQSLLSVHYTHKATAGSVGLCDNTIVHPASLLLNGQQFLCVEKKQAITV